MNLALTTHVGGRANASPLTPLGVAQAAALARRLAARGAPAALHASTAVRARETAEAIARAVGWEAAACRVSDELLEIDMGAWSGRARADCYTPDALAAIAADPAGFAPPGGESQREVEARMVAYITDTVLPAAPPGGPPVVVCSHGLAIKTFLRAVLASDPAAFAARNVALDNTGIVEVAHDARAAGEGRARDAWHVVRVNDAAHLEDGGLRGV